MSGVCLVRSLSRQEFVFQEFVFSGVCISGVCLSGVCHGTVKTAKFMFFGPHMTPEKCNGCSELKKKLSPKNCKSATFLYCFIEEKML